jgi:hypothetical protein
VPDLFTLPELEAYAADDWDPVRAPTIHALTLGTVYGLIPEAVADTSVRAKAIGLEAAKRAMELYDSESVDDYTWRRRNGSTRAGVHLTDDERAELLSVAAAASGVVAVAGAVGAAPQLGRAGVSAAATAARGRRAAERLMTSACTVFAPGEPVTDPQTGEVTDTQGAVWSGPCRIRPGRGRVHGRNADEVGGAEVFTYDYMVSLPVAVDVVVAGHRLTVTASPDAALAGVTMEVQRVDRGDTITARRLFCRDVA